MTDDPVVEEVRRIRQQIFAGYNYDLEVMGKALTKRTEESAKSGRHVVRAPAKSQTSPRKRVG